MTHSGYISAWMAGGSLWQKFGEARFSDRYQLGHCHVTCGCKMDSDWLVVNGDS